MPELPDVEGFRRELADHAANRRVESVRVHDSQVIQPVGADGLNELLEGRYLAEPGRHGKWLILPSAASAGAAGGPPYVLVHFGMTGMLLWCSRNDDGHAHDRVVLRFAEGELRYRDMRKLKGIRLAPRRTDLDEVLAGLGPDAATVGHQQCRARLIRTRRGMKSALMDQSTLAGLGNLCVDEILWRARIHPRQITTELDDARWKSLHRRMRSMLRQACRVACVPDRPSWLTGHRDNPNGRCPRCSTPLRGDKVAGRNTVWCPTCQAR